MPGAAGPILQLWHTAVADIARMWTAAGKAAFGLRQCQVGYFTINQLAARWLRPDINGRHRIQQCLAVGMTRRRKKALAASIFHELAHIHHRDVITHMLNLSLIHI